MVIQSDDVFRNNIFYTTDSKGPDTERKTLYPKLQFPMNHPLKST